MHVLRATRRNCRVVNFSIRIQRQRVEHGKIRWHHMLRKAAPGKGAQIIGGHARVFIDDDCRNQPLFAGDGALHNDARLPHRWMPPQRCLDLIGFDRYPSIFACRSSRPMNSRLPSGSSRTRSPVR